MTQSLTATEFKILAAEYLTSHRRDEVHSSSLLGVWLHPNDLLQFSFLHSNFNSSMNSIWSSTTLAY